MKIVICYGSYLGQTEKVASYLQEKLVDRGIDASLLKCQDPDSGVKAREADAVLIGSAIRAGKYHKKVLGFVKKNIEWLRVKKTGLFVVCLTAKSTDDQAQKEIQKYMGEFQEITGLSPALSRAFGGALVYTRYNFVLRYIMKRINQKYGGDTDTSKDFIYTNWDEVKSFADEFVGAMEIE